jgi:hypothetical protein
MNRGRPNLEPEVVQMLPTTNVSIHNSQTLLSLTEIVTVPSGCTWMIM